jgi:hypothetical protein
MATDHPLSLASWSATSEPVPPPPMTKTSTLSVTGQPPRNDTKIRA